MEPTIIARTDRLILRTTVDGDTEFMIHMFSEPEVCRFLGNGFAKNHDQSRRIVGQAIEHYLLHRFSRWTVARKDTGELIGLCGPMVTEVEGTPEVELGYFLAQEHWGRGYATEAASAAVDQYRHTCGKRITALIEPQNLASRRVAAKIGMKYERTVRWNERLLSLYSTNRSL